jgi:hypothetical protein
MTTRAATGSEEFSKVGSSALPSEHGNLRVTRHRQSGAGEAGVHELVEVVSLEPVILLAVTEKIRSVESLKVSQPFYQQAWAEQSSSGLNAGSRSSVVQAMQRLVPANRGVSINAIRNLLLVFGLASGRSRFSIRRLKKTLSDQFPGNQ